MENLPQIPQDPGAYLLWLHLPETRSIQVGRMGVFDFPAGAYVYLGSAFGPGGLRARLGRHLRGDGATRWHIDYLRAVAKVRGYGVQVKAENPVQAVRWECVWSQKLAQLPSAGIVSPGFGASDCRLGCRAHLVYLPVFSPASGGELLGCEIRHYWG